MFWRLSKNMVSNYRALRRAAPQQFLINDGEYMTVEKTQQSVGVASDLNAELGIACVGCISESKNELRCYDCKIKENGKGSNFLGINSDYG